MDRDFLEMLAALLSGLFLGAGAFLLQARFFAKKRDLSLKKETDMILNRAKSQALKLEREAGQKIKDREERSRAKLSEEIKENRARARAQEYNLKKKQSQMEEEFQIKDKEMEKAQKELNEENQNLQVSRQQVESLKTRVQKEKEEAERSMERLAGMTKEEAREQLKNLYEQEVRGDIADRLIDIEREMEKDHESKSRLLLAQAMARYSAEVTAERTVETLPITGAFSKGKIIGREGRNIKALESACGVDLLIGEGQEIVTISCFDPVRRAVARKALEKLMEEGRVHPAFIEEVVEKIRREIFSEMAKEGEKVCFDLGIHDISRDIIKVLGRLRYRFIEGQNLLKYSSEMAYIASLLASELGADKKPACRAGLLSAIGMGVPHFIEGSYSFVGAQFCRKQGESEEICQAILCHNGKTPARNLLDHIIQCAYNLSRSRSGAKSSVLDSYVNRLKDLESVANSFDGVRKSFALQAGHEIRVLVDAFKVVDEKQMSLLSWDIAKKIKREMRLSGDVKVSVIREYRIVEHAR